MLEKIKLKYKKIKTITYLKLTSTSINPNTFFLGVSGYKEFFRFNQTTIFTFLIEVTIRNYICYRNKFNQVLLSDQ